MAKRIGVISDTHGLLRPEAASKLRGCDLIVHAGDIGNPSVLEDLRQIAEVVAVRGNVDTGHWADDLPEIEYVTVDDKQLCVVHNIEMLDLDPVAAGLNIVVYGHSHKPAVDWKDGVLYLNPGSIGPRRFRLPVSMAFLRVEPECVAPEIVSLEDEPI
jgi:putative phosphoesterase